MRNSSRLAWVSSIVLAASWVNSPSVCGAKEAVGTLVEDEPARPPAPVLRHRLTVGLGLSVAESNSSPEGDHTATDNLAALRAGYAFLIVTGLEAGGDVTYWTGGDVRAFIPSLGVRGYVPIGARVELGLSGRFGLLIWPQWGAGTGAWTGTALSFGPDVRVWLEPGLGMQFSAEGASAGGTGPSQDSNLVSANADFFAVGGSVAFLARL